MPDAKRFFVMGSTDDSRGVDMTMATEPRSSFVVDIVASTPMLVVVVNGVILAAIVALLALQLGASAVAALVAGAIGFLVCVGALVFYASRSIAQAVASYEPMFPTPEPPRS